MSRLVLIGLDGLEYTLVQQLKLKTSCLAIGAPMRAQKN